MSDTPVTPPSITPGAPGLIERVQAILLRPRPTWEQIDSEPADVRSIYMGYVAPLAAIGPVATFIGLSVLGTGIGGFSYKVPFIGGLISAVISYVLALVMVYVTALIINALAPTFGGVKDPLKAFKVAAYSMTALWLGGIMALVPMLALLALVGVIYSLYLMALGLPRLMKSAPDKTVVYTAAVIVICIVINLIAVAVTSAVTNPLNGLGSMAASRSAGSLSLNTPDGTVNLDASQFEAAARQAEQATSTTPVAAESLKALLPQTLMGAAATDLSASSAEIAGASHAMAEARYAPSGGTLTLSVTDLGGMSGIGAMAQAMNINSSNETADGYERVRTENGRTISENYSHAQKSGSYTVLLGGRIAVSAEGTGVEASVLKAAVDAVDLSRAEALLK